jgi:hypothetical protein
MDEKPSFEDAMTVGMHAVADGIARSIEMALLEELKAAVRLFAARIRRQPVEPLQSPRR